MIAAVKRLVIMGGNEEMNDFTSTGAEFNFWCDPEAAQLVISKVNDGCDSELQTSFRLSAFFKHARHLKEVGLGYNDDLTKLQQKPRQDLSADSPQICRLWHLEVKGPQAFLQRMFVEVLSC